MTIANAVPARTYALLSNQYVQVTDWIPTSVQPVHIGEYQVREALKTEHRRAERLVGRPYRFWDGSCWRAWKGGPVSIFGKYPGHQWRGLVRQAGTTTSKETP